MTSDNPNVDAGEVSKFDALARSWWDREGDFKPLYMINPLRLGYITARVQLAGKRVLDVGCGGGILTEELAIAGAETMGIDVADKPLAVARLHAHESGLADRIDYQKVTIEDLAQTRAGQFDVITCLEMLEHVPDPGSVILACRQLLKPGGHLFLSTINRNAKAYLLAVIGAEYLLRMLPRGTHDYARFIKPSELAQLLRQHQFALQDVTGMTYNPISQRYRLGQDTDVNYLVYATSDTE